MGNRIWEAIALSLIIAAPAAGQRPARTLVSLGACDFGTYLASKVGEAVEWSFSVSATGEIVTEGPDSTTPDAATLAELAGDPLFSSVTANSTSPVMRTAQSLVDVPGGCCAIGSSLNLLIGGKDVDQ